MPSAAESSSPATGEPAPFVDVEWLAAHVEDPGVCVIEVDVAATSYLAGHVPGALLWNIYGDLRRPDYSPISSDELAALLSRSGVTPETTVVFYGYGSHLGYWLLTTHGHAQTRLLDGDREQWREAGRDWTTTTPTPAGTAYGQLSHEPALVETGDTVLANLGAPARILLDVRSAAEFDGERFWPSGTTEGAGRAGRLPGSIHLPIESFWREDGRLGEIGAMRRALADRGITPESRVVTYCTIGNRASQAWVALRYLLGFPDVAVYFGSWAEWGLLPGMPIEAGNAPEGLGSREAAITQGSPTEL